MFQNKDRVYMNGKGNGYFIGYEINSTNYSIVKFDEPNNEENKMGYTIVPTDLIELEDYRYKHYKLVSVFDAQTKDKMVIKDMINRWFPFQNINLKIDSILSFKMVDEPSGYRNVGKIISIESEIIRKRNYLFVNTGERIYRLLEEKR